MNFRIANASDVTAAEQAVDAAFTAGLKIPHASFEASLRHLLIAMEDRQRIPCWGSTGTTR